MKKLLLFTTLCLTFSVNAQVTFSEVQTNTNNPFLAMNSTSIAYGDIDGDDDLDVVICGSQNTTTFRTVLYRNNGLGIYTEDTSNTLLNITSGKVALKDLDGDSDKDLILAGYNSSNIWETKIYENNGTGSFSEITNPNIVPFYSGTYALADVDGDNDLDLLTAGKTSSSASIGVTILYTNNGSGIFSEVIGTTFSGAFNGSSINFADIDGDGDQDVFITASDTGSAGAKLYTNDGSGVFTEVTGTSISPTFFAGVQFEDVDNDNDKDLIIAASTGGKIYLNNSLGNFTEDTSTNIIGLSNSTLVFSDVDGDNDRDFYIVGRNYNNGGAVEGKLYKNDGVGGFTEEVAVIIEPAYSSASNSDVAFFDKDDDGDDDLLIIGYNPSFVNVANLYENDGSGNFTSIYDNTSVINVTISKNVFADIDNDGDQDLLIAGSDGTNRITKLYDNDGIGQFTENIYSTFENISSPSIAFADIDNDSDLDVIISGDTNAGAISKLYTNDGTGKFTEVIGQSFVGIYSGSSVFEDIDNDNDLDLIMIGSSTSNLESKIYKNDGSGIFTIATNFFAALDSASISFADIDADGDKDAILTGRDNSFIPVTYLYLNDGLGNFTIVSSTGLENVFGKSLFSDIDNDGDQDLLLTGYNDLNVPSSKLYTNNGSGTFTEISGAGIQPLGYNDAVFTDIDNDSDFDILIVGYNGSLSVAKLYLNDGSGSFTEITGLPFEGVSDGSIAIADFNGDNKKDVLISGSNFGTISTKRYINDSTLSTTNYSFNKNQISLFPNPSSNYFEIQSKEILTKVEVYSLQGQLVKSFVPQSQYDISNLSSGLYLVKILANNDKITKRLIKQ